MDRIICDDYESLSNVAADIIAAQLNRKHNSVLGLATGSTPLGLYAELVRRFDAGEIDFSGTSSYNLDEYYPINKDHPQSYNYYMRENLFSKVNFAFSRLFDGEAADPQAECAKFDSEISTVGGIDLQLLGVGINGHIGFNEPAESYSMASYLVELADSTLAANSRFFTSGEVQPKLALTMGFGAIFNAKSILLLISGASKAPIAKRLFEGRVYSDTPASLLLLHPDVTVLIDRDALGA